MKVTHQIGDPKSLTLLDENARFMPHDKFQQLVRQVKADGVLQQWPFVYNQDGRRLVLSGNHRVKAAIEAGLEVVDWTECDEPLTLDEQRRIQLAHNAITGEDDPEILRRLYESIEDVEQRIATGLDDDELGNLFKASTEALAEANLDFTTLTIVFLPDEYERASTAFEEARTMGAADHRWLARFEQHNALLDQLQEAQDAAGVLNQATALDVLLDCWDRNVDQMRELWATADGDPIEGRKRAVPLSTVTGRIASPQDAAVIGKAIKKAVARGDASNPADVLAHWARAYLDK